LGHTEDDVDIKKVVSEVQTYYNAQEKREWVKWAGKILMPRLHAQMAMAESVAEGPVTTQATTQDGEVGESEREESAEEGLAAAEVVVESSMV
jgi:hypothetical protein